MVSEGVLVMDHGKRFCIGFSVRMMIIGLLGTAQVMRSANDDVINKKKALSEAIDAYGKAVNQALSMIITKDRINTKNPGWLKTSQAYKSWSDQEIAREIEKTLPIDQVVELLNRLKGVGLMGIDVQTNVQTWAAGYTKLSIGLQNNKKQQCAAYAVGFGAKFPLRTVAPIKPAAVAANNQLKECADRIFISAVNRFSDQEPTNFLQELETCVTRSGDQVALAIFQAFKKLIPTY